MDFREKIIEDEGFVAAKAIDDAIIANTRACWTNREARRRVFKQMAVFDDGSAVAALALDALRKSKTAGKGARVVHCGPGAAARAGKPPRLSNHIAALLFADCRTAPRDPAGWLTEARALFAALAKDRNSFAVVCALLPEIDPLPDGVTALAEREYAALLEGKPEKSPAEQFLIDVEGLCREAVRDKGANVVLLRVPHVFGPTIADERGFSVRAIVEEALAANGVKVGAEDFATIRSLTTATDAVCASWWALLNATPGNVFNIVSFEASAADLKRAIRAGFPERFWLSAECPAGVSPEYRCLSPLKFANVKYKKTVDINEALGRLVCLAGAIPFRAPRNASIFRGRENRIKALEMDILREIDRICEKHGIKYFLAAGTLLGAKRYGHSIPWDDDLDVGFLRGEFKKFRKVVERELPPHMVYCAWYNDAKAHYTVDKIRIRDTWYSTQYSSNKVMPDGVFVDFLVYDPTSDIPAIAWFHNKIAGIYQWFLLQVLWFGLQRRDFANPLLYALYNIVRIVPLSAWHWLYERWLTLFSFKRRPKFLLDSLGARAGIKLIPSEGLLDGTVRIPFDEGFMAPSPKDPEGYLRFAYGANWREEPPICDQELHHNPARIDMGALLLGNGRATRPLDLRGELLEKERESL